MNGSFQLLLFGIEGFAFILAPLLPALIALYFLKLKREQVIVSSTFLWKKSIEDLRVNAPFQRLRKSLLLLLQLLALAALILAASKPYFTRAGAGGRNIFLLIDNSASMNSREDGGTRLELARKEARAMVEELIGGDRMAILTFSHRTSVLQPLTSDRAQLLRAVDSVPATSLPTELFQALRTAGALAESLPAAEVYVIGDGAYGIQAALPPEIQRLAIRYSRVGTGQENLGITELDVRRSFGFRQRLELFVSVKNSTGEEQRTALGIYRDDRLIAARELVIPAGRSFSHAFDATRFLSEESALSEGDPEPVILRLEVADGGLLEDDDRAYVRLMPPERMDVLVVGEENFALDRILAVQDHIDARRVSLGEFEELAAAGKLASEPAKVVIFDRRAPPGPPDRPALYLGSYPDVPELFEMTSGESKEAGSAEDAGKPQVIKNPVIVDWDGNHPVNRFLSFADLKIEESFAFQPGRAYRSLINSGKRSIVGTANFYGEGRLPATAVLVGFDVLKSNWPWLHSFPIFFGNVLEYLGDAAGGATHPRYRAGEVLMYYPEGKDLEDPVFRDPKGQDFEASPERTGELSFSRTELPGIYELRSGGEVLERYPVSLLNSAETEIAPKEEIQFGTQVVQSQAATLETLDLWKWFVLAALAVICLEWWVYQRRVV